MKVVCVSFKRDIRLYGNFFAPKTISMENPADSKLWSVEYQPHTGVFELSALDPRQTYALGKTFLVPREHADSWVLAETTVDSGTKPIKKSA